MATSMPVFYNNNSDIKTLKNSYCTDNTSSQPNSNIVTGAKLDYEQNHSLGVHLLDRLNKYGQQVAQIDPISGDCTTFNDIKLLSIKLAKCLRNYGIGSGDVVSICSRNNLDVCLPVLGALYVGATVVPLHSSLCRPDLKHLLSITQPKIIFCDHTSIEIISKSLAELKLSIDLIIFGDTKIRKSLDQFLNKYSSDEDEFIPFDCADPWNQTAFVMPTNGTKDMPRGVCITHANILHHLQSYWNMQWIGLGVLNVATLYSIAGIKSMLLCLDRGCISILSPEFNPEAIGSIISSWKDDLILISSTVCYTKLINSIQKNQFNLYNCKLILIYGSKITDQHYKMTDMLFPDAKLYLGYGSVETTGMVTTPIDKKFCCGIPDPDCEIKVVDPETGRILGPQMLGELHIRGKRIMLGYYKDDIATSVSLDKDGWYHTGDLGYFDEDRCFYIEGSMSEKFTHKNCEVMPFEIEKVLLENPEIKEVCVIGIRHKIDGYRAKAFIVRQPNSTISESRIKKYLEGQLSPFKQVTGGITFMEKLPVTPSGKINRRKLMKLP